VVKAKPRVSWRSPEYVRQKNDLHGKSDNGALTNIGRKKGIEFQSITFHAVPTLKNWGGTANRDQERRGGPLQILGGGAAGDRERVVLCIRRVGSNQEVSGVCRTGQARGDEWLR